MTFPRRSAESARPRPWLGVAVTTLLPDAEIVTGVGALELRRPRLSTATTRSSCRPSGRNAGSTSSAYGRVVSEPSGRPSSRKVTATTRAARAVARAFKPVGAATVFGPRYSTLGRFPDGAATGADDRSQPVKTRSARRTKRRVRVLLRTEPSKGAWAIWS